MRLPALMIALAAAGGLLASQQAAWAAPPAKPAARAPARPAPRPAAPLIRTPAEARAAELALLGDAQCAARFMLLSELYPGNPAFVQAAKQRLAWAGNKAFDARLNLPPEQVIADIKAQADARGSRIRDQQGVLLLMEEVNACETRYAMPLTRVTQTPVAP